MQINKLDQMMQETDVCVKMYSYSSLWRKTGQIYDIRDLVIRLDSST